MSEQTLNSIITLAQGFQCAGVHCGLKSSRPDLGLLVCEQPATAAMMVTRNRFRAAPVEICLEHFAARDAFRAVVVNSGNANACTGALGLDDARAMTRETAQLLGCAPEETLVCSTGVIGHQLPMDKIISGIKDAAQQLRRGADEAFVNAIMTTDKFPKAAAVTLDWEGAPIHVGGVAKGAGMIHPDMATMLCFLTTDAGAEKAWLQGALRRAVEASFNSLTVDGDTSTNDTVILFASGAAGAQALQATPKLAEKFENALHQVCTQLAKAMARDGEGATKLLTIICEGAASNNQARQVAQTVATSLLVKTAMFGGDPNWGRIAAAVGRSGAQYDPNDVKIAINDVPVFGYQMPMDFDRARLSEKLKQWPEIKIYIRLGFGPGNGTYYGCDLTYEYVKINAEYHT